MIFKDSEHAQRWEEAVRTAGAVRDDGTVDCDFGASLYILTGLPSVYDRVQQHIHSKSIHFEPMLRKGLSTGENILVALAGNLYNGGFFHAGSISYTPLDIVSLCDADGVVLATRALLLRKRRINISEILSE